MTKTCPSCSYTGDLTWRDGKYHCAMCDREISEDSPVVQKYQESVVQNITCPICKNSENNLFNGARYRCALCGTAFDEPYEEEYNSYYQPYSGTNASRMQRIEALREEKNIGYDCPYRWTGTGPVYENNSIVTRKAKNT